MEEELEAIDTKLASMASITDEILQVCLCV